MKSYGQYCALARGLDVVGERWSLLIVRELMGGPRRYGELVEGLPGIATNLLAERLRHLVGADVIERQGDGRYALTPWGEGLREPLYALARWSAPVAMTNPAGDDAFHAAWLAHPVAVMFEGVDPRRPALTIEVRIGDEAMTIESRDGKVTLRPGHPPSPDIVLDGPPDAILGLLAGRLDPGAAAKSGVSIIGNARLVVRLRPNLLRPIARATSQ
ncbi:MAG: winged helix-turn-helix transcriptional regulator [Acidimicrobiales bacterium]